MAVAMVAAVAKRSSGSSYRSGGAEYTRLRVWARAARRGTFHMTERYPPEKWLPQANPVPHRSAPRTSWSTSDLFIIDS